MFYTRVEHQREEESAVVPGGKSRGIVLVFVCVGGGGCVDATLQRVGLASSE